MSGHDGKDCVFIAQWTHNKSKIVIKARTLTTFELIGNNNWIKLFKNDKQLVLRAINDIMNQRFDYSYNETISKTNHLINKLISWPMNGIEDYMNETSLINIWLLIQDNEYILSKTYENLFPTIVGTCGHFYGVQYAEHILDLSYFLPQLLLFSKQTLLNRIRVGIKVIQFLKRFESMKPKLQLCDIKFQHFGLFDDKLLLIDSDMIYPKKAVIDSIKSLSNCKDDNDCHFIDCKGICFANKCIIDDKDDDLMRVCRNIFFMGTLYGVFDLGLFSDRTHELRTHFDLIEKKCFVREELSSDINHIHTILLDIRNKLTAN